MFNILKVGTLSYQSIVDGMVDKYIDETGVDTSTSTNEPYNSGSYYYSTNSLTTSSSGEWNGDTGNWTFGAGSLTHIGTAESGMYSTGYFSGDFELNFTRSDSTLSWGIGVYHLSEQGSFLATGSESYNANMVGMTNSWWIGTGGSGTTTVKYGATTQLSNTAFASGAVGKIERVGSTFKFYIDGVLRHTWSQTSSSEVRIGFGSNISGTYSNISWTGPILDISLVSNSITANSTPTTAHITIWQENVDSVTLNTDLKAYASCDNGSTWDQISLSQDTTLSTGRILSGSVSLTSSETSMRYKIETLNTKEQRIHAVGLQWS